MTWTYQGQANNTGLQTQTPCSSCLTMLNTKPYLLRSPFFYHICITLINFSGISWYLLFSFLFLFPLVWFSFKNTVLRHWWGHNKEGGMVPACIHLAGDQGQHRWKGFNTIEWLLCAMPLLHAALGSAYPTILEGNITVLILQMKKWGPEESKSFSQ